MSDQEPTRAVDCFDSLQSIFDTEDEILTPVEKPKKLTSSDRLERSFLEIIEFVQANGREPSADTREISERKLGARLYWIRVNPEKMEALKPLDTEGLLVEEQAPTSLEELFAGGDDPLGLLEDASGIRDVSSLPVPKRKHENTEAGAQRHPCEDFDKYEPLFKQKQEELAAGAMKLVPFTGRQSIVEGAFFVLKGALVFVAEIGEVEYKKTTVRENRRERLRLIFENGTESAMYRQSFSLRLGEGTDGYQVVPAEFETIMAEDEATGWIYILKSLSTDPGIATIQDLYKIGFSTTPVKQRVTNAAKEPTYLMAPVEIVAEYRTYNMKTSALEHLLHRVFADTRLDIAQVGPNGVEHRVTEWFQVPLEAINQAITLVTDGSIVEYGYDADRNTLELHDN